MKKSQTTLNQLKNSYLNCRAFLFDLDHTLLHANTSFKFGWYLYRQKILPFFKMLYLFGCYGIHLLGGISIQSLHRLTMRTFFKGRSIKEINNLAKSFLDTHLFSMQNEPVMSILRRVQQEGKFVAILSSSPDFLVKAIAARWNVGNFLATRYELNSSGVIGGIAVSVQGCEKAEYVKKLGYDPSDVAGFSDSIHDLPFLKAVGCPVAVNPDRKLLRTSKKFGWEVI